ncbi:hypothetical protein HPB49_009129 [Dermacentor silvarum]|uniref:Uncharacterized protein n=1 Tax=Dermacentor silvarum TaxID=543639 RepID=A0ACB8DYB9_DERSI|nr:hypothetical protein HPB49_009129 [Dermacentor silvarum]
MGILPFSSAHSKLIKRGVASAALGNALQRSCYHQVHTSFCSQVERLLSAGYPSPLLTGVAEKLLEKCAKLSPVKQPDGGRSRSAKCSSTTSAFFVLTVFLCALATSCLCDGETDSDLTTAATVQPNVSYVAKLREFIGNAMDGASPRLARKVLEADLSVDCSIGLFKLVRGIRNLDPWAMRLFDASGKYPTGALSTTRVDLGAFDECVETVVHDDYGRETARAQYCNLMAYAGNKTDLDDHITEAVKFSHPRVPKFREHVYEQRVPILRLGICVLDACSERELNSLLKAVLPRIVDVTITNCVTSIPPEITKTQRIILACLGALTLLIALGTAVDLCCSSSKEKGAAKNILLSVVTSFSVVSNTRMMLNIPTDKTSDSYSMKFLHGIRFWSIVWVLVGHSYGAPSDVWSRMVNVIIYAEKWQNVITTVGFMSVDCFFFLSGFLLAYVVCKQKRTGIVLFLFATIRRLIRTMAPVFFLIMVLHLMPLITSGPDAKSYFDKVHTEFQRQWLLILLQVQNYDFDVNANSPVFGHLWYLSLDFQFFLVSLPVLLLLKSPCLCIAFDSTETVINFNSTVRKGPLHSDRGSKPAPESVAKIPAEIRDLILTPPETNPYDVLSAELLKRTTSSEKQRLQQILSAEELHSLCAVFSSSSGIRRPLSIKTYSENCSCSACLPLSAWCSPLQLVYLWRISRNLPTP